MTDLYGCFEYPCMLYIGPSCVDQTIRLINDGPYITGQVQLCYKQSWTSIAEARITPEVATVICRQLGYSDTGTCICIFR